MVELNEQDFQIFKDEAKYWIDKFGLKDWRIGFEFKKHDNDAYAQCDSQLLGRWAYLILNKWQDEKPSFIQIKKSAFHEVCEVLFQELRRTALNENIPYDERVILTDAAAHGVIRRLENSVFKMQRND